MLSIWVANIQPIDFLQKALFSFIPHSEVFITCYMPILGSEERVVNKTGMSFIQHVLKSRSFLLPTLSLPLESSLICHTSTLSSQLNYQGHNLCHWKSDWLETLLQKAFGIL